MSEARLNAVWQQLYPYLTSPITWIVFVFGSIVGSFLNVCVFRIPQGTFWKNQRSVCPHCGTPIPAYLNIPILGWFIVGGRARCCKSRLSIQYPILELLTAILLVICYWEFPFAVVYQDRITWDALNMIRFGHVAIFVSILLVCSFVDIRLMIIPDILSLGLIATTPLVIWIHPELDWVSGLFGVLIGGASLYAIAWIYWLLKHEVGMGMGDVKLLAGIGGWLGYQSIIPTIFYGSILGAIIGVSVMLMSKKLSMRSAIPFGPFLAIGAIIHLLMGSELQSMLLRP